MASVLDRIKKAAADITKSTLKKVTSSVPLLNVATSPRNTPSFIPSKPAVTPVKSPVSPVSTPKLPNQTAQALGSTKYKALPQATITQNNQYDIDKAEAQRTINRVNSLDFVKETGVGLGKGVANVAGKAVKNVVEGFGDVNTMAKQSGPYNYISAPDGTLTRVPKYKSAGEALFGSVADTATKFLPTVVGAGAKIGDIPTRALTNPMSLIGDVVAEAEVPEDLKSVVRPASEIISLVTAPKGKKLLSGLNTLVGYGTTPISNAINEADIDQSLKNTLNAVLNQGENALALLLNKGVKAGVNKYGAPTKVGMGEALKTGSINKGIEAAVTKFTDLERLDRARQREADSAAGASGEVLGYSNIDQGAEIPSKAVEPVKAMAQDGQDFDGPIVKRIAQGLSEIDQELGLQSLTSKDFGKTDGLLGTVLGAPAALRRKMTGSSLPLIQQKTGALRESFAQGADQALSDAGIAGKAFRGAKSLVGGLGRTDQQTSDLGKIRGAMADFKERADFVSKKVLDDLKGEMGMKVVPESLEKIHALLDPELAQGKFKGVTEASLSPAEKTSLNLLKKVSNVINDINYQIGGISKAQWEKGKDGKYIARAYNPIEFPDDRPIGTKAGAPETGGFKQRKELDDWKQENAIRDPVYLMNKRLIETGKNMALKRYFELVGANPDYVSDTKRPGYVEVKGADVNRKASDHDVLRDYVEKTYGVTGDKAEGAIKQLEMNGEADGIINIQKGIYSGLKGKFIRQDILDDIEGFSFATDALQQIYDFSKKYTEPVARKLKVAKTALALPVRLQNKVSNLWYATLGGVNPAEMFAERAKLLGNTVTKGGDVALRKNPMFRFLLQNGIVDSDFSKKELQGRTQDVAKGTGKSAFQKAMEYPLKSYGTEDTKSKVAYATILQKRGYSGDEILKQVRDTFQDYGRVGKVFDFASKLPVFGMPFSKWKSEGARLFKNSLVNRPLRALTLMFAFNAAKNAISAASGETEEERNTREGRPFATTMPFSDLLKYIPVLGDQVPEHGISTEIMLPKDVTSFFGAPDKTVINLGRLWGQQLANEEENNQGFTNRRLAELSPFSLPKQASGTEFLRALGSGIVLGPAIQAASDTDFRGKSIQDPSLNKFRTESYLSGGEKAGNLMEYLTRAYSPPITSDILDTQRAAQGRESYYGSKRTLPQQLLRATTGIKSEVFDSGRIQQMQEYKAEGDAKEASERINFQIKDTIAKAAVSGKLDAGALVNNITQYVELNGNPSPGEIEEARGFKKNKDLKDDVIFANLKKQKQKQAIRQGVRMSVDAMVNEGTTNTGVRGEYLQKIIPLLETMNATYEDKKDFNEAVKKINEEIASRWR